MALHFVVSMAAPVVSVVTKIGEYLVAPVGRQFGYLIFYNRNIKNLEEQVQKLKDKKIGTQLLVEAAKRNTEIIGPDVERWLTKVDQLGEEAKKFQDEVKANKGCLNLKSRHSLSRKAKKKTQDVVKVYADGNFSRVGYPAPPAGIASIPTEDFKGFESRKAIMNEVMEALADDSINMIGICGMGGVGKTTLVKEVAKKAKEKNLFDEDVMVVVSQSPESIKIQGGIAEMLHLDFCGNINLFERANKLRTRISSGKRILIILDDVWDELKLDEIGIPFGNDCKGCKIVLTSRSEAVCKDMRTQKQITIQVLHEEEAWNLFKEVAGISSDASTTIIGLYSTQKAVAKECGGLPIAILTVGKALYGKENPSWDDALNQLQKSLVKNIRGVHAKVFLSLELSYNYLESEEAKKLFLLCSLFPEDFSIPIEDLVRYGIGLKLFAGISTVDDARNRVHALVDDLMKCYLLMDDKKGVSIRMHDVIRDVTISIASRKKHSFMVRCDEALKEWSEDDRHENYTAISLRCTAMHDLPDNLELPNLKLLRLEYNRKLPETPDCFYQGMKELKVVALSNMYVQSLPASFRYLTNIRTLSLYNCILSGDISVIGALKNLEILSFAHSNSMKGLPKEIANLTRLKLLDLNRCWVERISPGVLSSLSRLEELYVGDRVREWSVPSLLTIEEDKGREQEIISDAAAAASITELASLSNLVALDIHIEFWPKDFVLEKVKKFRISIGQGEYVSFSGLDSYRLKNQLKLQRVDASVVKSEIKMLLKSTEILELKEIAGLKNIPCDLYKDIFKYLKELIVRKCGDLEYLINTTTTDDDNDDDDGVVPQRAFPVLEVLNLYLLYNFKGIICDGGQQLSKKKKKKEEEVELQNLPQIPHHNKIDGPAQLDWLCNLTSVDMCKCDMVESLFPLYMARGLMQLRTLDIRDCKMMESIVSSGEGGGGGEHEITTATTDHIEFPKLQELFLMDLPSLIAFCNAVNAIELPHLNKLTLISIPKLRSSCYSTSESNYDTIIRPLFDKIGGPRQLDWFCNLTSVQMRGCHMVESLFDLSMARGLMQLRTLDIFRCKMMESIVSSSEGGGEHGKTSAAIDPIEFPKLQKLEFGELPSLIAFSKAVNAIELPQLNELTLYNIPKLKSLYHSASESNYDTIIRPLFDKIGGPRQLDWFCNLTNVQIRDCDMVESLFDLSMARGLVQLRTLDIRWCKMTESIVSSSEGGGEHEKTLAAIDPIEFPKLQKLDLDGLPSLITLCKAVNVIELPQLNELELVDIPKLKSLYHLFDKNGGPIQLDWLCNLTSVTMARCGIVESMFSLSMARGHMQLQKLEIKDCKMIESIVSSSEGGKHEITTTAVDPIEFPKLQELCLKHLPSFTAFCKVVDAIGLPQLNNLELVNIPKLRSFRHPTSENNDDTIIRPLFDKVQLTSIEKLSLSGMDNLIEIWPRELNYKAKLREMRVHLCHRLLSILSSSNLIECLQNLELLQVKECRLVEVAFDLGGLIVREGHPAIALLSLLTIVKLIHLPKLTHVWMNNSPAAGIQGFNNLTSLTVKGCGSLRNLFSSSMAKLLVKLKALEITECVAMEAIISKEKRVDDDDDGGGMITTTNTIIFPRLYKLQLSSLPNLMSFSPQGNTFKGSYLRVVQVINCPKMEALPLEFQRRQELQRSNEGFHEVVQKTNKVPRKFMLTSTGEFIVMEINEATEIWQNQLEAECLHEVIRMWVQCCGNLSSVVSTSLIQKFHNLKQLKVWWCDLVEVIFDLEEVFAEEGAITQFSELEFKYLPKLADIWKINFPQQTHYFRYLRSLKVKRCDNLRYIFTLSMAKVLVNLEYLKVGHCEKVEKIVTREEGEEEERGRTILPKLGLKYKSVTLKDLPSLVCFGIPVGHLRNLKVEFCPKFQSP